MVRFNEHRWGKDSASSRKGTGAQTVALPHDHALVLFSGSGVRNPRYHHSSIRMAGKRQWHPCTYKTKAECWESPSGPVQAYLKSPQCQSRYCVTLLSYTLAWENLSSQPFLCFVFAGGGGGGWVGGRWGSLSGAAQDPESLGITWGRRHMRWAVHLMPSSSWHRHIQIWMVPWGQGASVLRRDELWHSWLPIEWTPRCLPLF